MSNFIKISTEGVGLFHADGHSDRHEAADCRSSQFLERVWKLSIEATELVYSFSTFQSISRDYVPEL